MRNDKWLYLPIDVKVRELEAKVLLSCYAVKSGYTVVLGSHTYLTRHMDRFPPGIFFDKIAVAGRKGLFTKLKGMGHKVVTLDEEGLVYLPTFYAKNRVSEDVLQTVEGFFAWGSRHANDIINKAPRVRGKVLTTGNPRLDLLRREFRGFFEKRKNDIQERYGPIILINSNFPVVNSLLGDQEYILSRYREMEKIVSEEDEVRYREFFGHRTSVFEHFKEMIPEVSRKFGHRNIILRPHPAENHRFWKEFAAPLKNVHVVHDGSVVPWIMASDAMVHNGCTTAVESFLLDVPAIVFLPVRSDVYDLALPMALSTRAHDVAELLNCLDDIVNKRDRGISGSNDERLAIAHEYISGISGPTASEKILEAIDHIGMAPSPLFLKNRAGIFWARWTTIVKEKVKPFVKARGRKDRFSRQVNPGISLDEVEDILRSVKGLNGPFPEIRVRPLGFNCFMLTSSAG